MRVTTQVQFDSYIGFMGRLASDAFEGKVIDFASIGDQTRNIERLCGAVAQFNGETLSLTNQPWSDATLAQVIDALQDNKRVTILNLSGNQMGPLSAAALIRVLKQKRIMTLDVSNNPLGLHIDDILRAVKNNRVSFFFMKKTHPLGSTYSKATAQLISDATSSPVLYQINIENNSFDVDALDFLKNLHDFFIKGLDTCNSDFPSPSMTSRTLVSSSSSMWSTTSTVSSISTPEPMPTTPKKQFFYAVSSERLRETADTATTVDQAHDIFKKSKQFRVFNTLRAAQDDRYRKEQKGWLGSISYPVIFEMVTKAEFEIAENMNIEKHHIDIANFPDSAGTTNIFTSIFTSSRHEAALLALMQRALSQYSREINSTASFGSADEGGGMCSTLIDDSTAHHHSTLGVDRASNFVDSLRGLDLKSMLKKMHDYNEGMFTGNYEEGKSFKAILQRQLRDQYTPGAYCPVSSAETLRDKILTVESKIALEVDGEVKALKTAACARNLLGFPEGIILK